MAVLSIVESMRLAEKHGVRFAPYSFVENEKGLEHACGKIGFPVAMKTRLAKLELDKPTSFIRVRPEGLEPPT